jgi:peptidyl-prolyl cis-trans isomerase SurA
MILIRNFILVGFLLLGNLTFSQQVIDQIIAVVGDETILKSEIEAQVIQMKSQGYVSDIDLNCEVLEEMLFQKLLLKQAINDSIDVTVAEVDNELNRRLGVFINQLGSEQRLEEYYGKSILDIKTEFRTMIKEQLLTQRMQQELTMNVKITPSEVKSYFKRIPEDSLPELPSSYQLQQIVIYPKISKEEKEKCLTRINQYRERILSGDDFSTLAVLYSDDPGSSPQGGELGFVSRTDLVPEFASAAFNLQNPDDVSRVVETEFGYHILQLIEKKGNLVNVRHILVTPKTDRESENMAKLELENIRIKLMADSIQFETAASEYSEDEMSANSGGNMVNQMTGESWFDESELDPLASSVIRQMSTGEVSKVIKTRDYRGKTVYKIYKLKRKVERHIANINDDYTYFQNLALEEKKADEIKDWIEKSLESTYVRIDSSYLNCRFKYADWIK